MHAGLYAFGCAAAFLGAAVYVCVVEQPARLALPPDAMMKEFKRSDRRGSLLLSILAVASAILASIQFKMTGDVRWIIGGVIILSTWPYEFFVIVPVNVWLYSASTRRRDNRLRKLMRDWGLLELGHALIALTASGDFAWVLEQPA
jgi:hypothetical protein